METYRLKNIAIVLLLLLNSFLLLLVGYQRLQERRTVQETSRQLQELCSASQLALSGGLDLAGQPLAPLALARRAETEQAIASSVIVSLLINSIVSCLGIDSHRVRKIKLVVIA